MFSKSFSVGEVSLGNLALYQSLDKRENVIKAEFWLGVATSPVIQCTTQLPFKKNLENLCFYWVLYFATSYSSIYNLNFHKFKNNLLIPCKWF